MAVQQFRPGVVYSRRRATRAPPPASDAQDDPQDINNVTLTFINTVSCNLTPPLLQAPPRNSAPPRRQQKRTATSLRKSVRLAARTWPRGDAQAKARQVLLKKLGITEEEGLSEDDEFLRYFNLFKGPLTDEVIKAMTALCGLDAAEAIAAQA